MRIRAAVALVLALTTPAAAQWDKSKPAASSALYSVDFRNNWAALETAVGGVNLLADPTFLIWPAGDTTAPAHWNPGTAPTIARTGTGLVDTARKIGPYAIKLTAGGTGGTLAQSLLPAGAYDDGFDLRSLSCGAWVKAAVPSAVRTYMTDGAVSSFSAYHSGSGAWEWLTFSHTVNAAATDLSFVISIAASQVGYLSGPTCILGKIPPADYIPAPVIIQTERFFRGGVANIGTRPNGFWSSGTDFMFPRPTLIKAVSMNIITAPAGTNIIIDVNHYDGTSHQSMFTNRPTLLIGSLSTAMFVPDGPYRYRCFAALTTNTLIDTLLSVDIDQVGSATPGSDLNAWVTYMQYARPLEAFLLATSVN